MSYSATIAKISKITPHPNADKIQLAEVMGEQVVVGLNTQVDDIGIYFPVDGQLSEDFVKANNLYNKSTAELLNTGATSYGFFDKNRRVRAQTFRGSKSEGFWIPRDSLKFVTPYPETDCPLGMSFDTIGVIPICNKYITKATKVQGQQTRSAKRGETLMFPKHYDTDQFRHKWEEIPEGSIIYLTEKLHGTSGRTGYVYDEFTPTNFVDRCVAQVRAYMGLTQRRHWTTLNGTRNVVLEKSSGKGFYGSDDFRTSAVKDLALRKGEVIYYELVGDVSVATPIMPECAVDKKELPEIFAQYGPTMRYRYGQPPGTTGLYVYRIVQMNEDGQGIDLPWPQVKKRCGQLSLNHVPELKLFGTKDCFIWDDNRRVIALDKEEIESLSHGPSLLDSSHIREGVAIRIETPDGRIYSLKEKSFEFKFLEGIVKSKDSYVDTEEAS